MRMSFTTHNTFLVFGTIWCLVSKTLALKTLLNRGCCTKFLDLGIYSCFWYISPPEMSTSACFGSLHLILMKGRSLPDLFYFVLSAIEIFYFYVIRYSFKDQNVFFMASAK